MNNQLVKLLIVAILGLLAYCVYSVADGLSLRSDQAAKTKFSDEIHQKVTIGSSPEAAKDILTKYGYEWLPRANSSEYYTKEYLYFRKIRWVLLGSYIYKINLEVENNRIKSIETDIGSSSL